MNQLYFNLKEKWKQSGHMQFEKAYQWFWHDPPAYSLHHLEPKWPSIQYTLNNYLVNKLMNEWMNEWTNNQIEKRYRPSPKKTFPVIHAWFFRNKYLPADLPISHGCKKPQCSFKSSSRPVQKCPHNLPVKKFFDLFWRGTFYFHSNDSLNE